MHGGAIDTPVMLVGQAPGIHEESRGRPFAHTAGKTLFGWLGEATGADEESLRQMIYFSAVLRCFPGKNPGGAGDRPPAPAEIANCREHLAAEVRILRPKLILAVGRVAILELLGDIVGRSTRLDEVVGRKFAATVHGHRTEVICLPHPSGVSRWHRVEPGKSKVRTAIVTLGREFRALNL